MRRLRSCTRKPLLMSLSALLLLAALLATVRFTIHGDLEGIYILKGSHGKLLELKDDVLLGEYERVLFKADRHTFHLLSRHLPESTPHEAYLTYQWNRKWGHGFVQSFAADGSRFIVCFSRFRDSNGTVPRGLFVGGGLPYSRYESSKVQLNETGVAFYKNAHWYHIWCNANEAIAGSNSPDRLQFPANWEYLGSKICYATSKKIMLQSSHRTEVDGVPVRIERFMLYRAGDRYFILVTRIQNIGAQPTGYFFVYGDEPWVGDYGSSMGNIGWVGDRLYHYEAMVDPTLYNFAGMYDHGNPVVLGEHGPFSDTANFIEWLGDLRPDLVYFSNKEGEISDESARIPLSSRDNRVMFLQWGPRQLMPAQTETIVLAIGMADKGQRDEMPRKPIVSVDWSDLHTIMTAQ